MLSAVYKHLTFEFKDGGISPKRFIIVHVSGDPEKDDPKHVKLNVVKTTSQQGNETYRPSAKGCYNDHRKVFKIDAGESKRFEEDTWVQFDFYEYTLKKLQEDYKSQKVSGLGDFEIHLMKELLGCIKYCTDIPVAHTQLAAESLDKLNS